MTPAATRRGRNVAIQAQATSANRSKCGGLSVRSIARPPTGYAARATAGRPVLLFFLSRLAAVALLQRASCDWETAVNPVHLGQHRQIATARHRGAPGTNGAQN